MSIYQQAKARFESDQTHPSDKPDSLTRRGETLIAAKYYGNQDKQMIKELWESTIKALFPSAKIHKTTVHPLWYTVRCYFSI